MLISVEKRLAVFAMPKCASSAIHAEFAGVNAIRLAGSPDVKHTNFQAWAQYFRPWLDSLGIGPIETVCLFREPLDWLESHWRYRQRDDHAEATAGFEAAANQYTVTQWPAA